MLDSMATIWVVFKNTSWLVALREAGRQLALHPAHGKRMTIPDVGEIKALLEEWHLLLRRIWLLINGLKEMLEITRLMGIVL